MQTENRLGVTVRDWIRWGLVGGRCQPRYPADTSELTHIVNRDLGLSVTINEVHRALLDAGFHIADRSSYACHYLAEDTTARNDFERACSIWHSRLAHPLLQLDYRMLFQESEHRQIIERFLIQFVRPCSSRHREHEILDKLVQFSGLDVSKDVLRGALMVNGMRPVNAQFVKWDFRVCVDERAFRDWRIANSQRAQA
jgi:hypothetical protein